MERRHVLRGTLPGGGLHPERAITELDPAERSREVARWSRKLAEVERKIAREQRGGSDLNTMAGLYAEASHACIMLEHAMRGFRWNPNAARRNAERRIILDALGE